MTFGILGCINFTMANESLNHEDPDFIAKPNRISRRDFLDRAGWILGGGLLTVSGVAMIPGSVYVAAKDEARFKEKVKKNNPDRFTPDGWDDSGQPLTGVGLMISALLAAPLCVAVGIGLIGGALSDDDSPRTV